MLSGAITWHLVSPGSWRDTVLYYTVLYCTVLYCTVLYCTVLYCTDLAECVERVHGEVQPLYCTVLYCTILYCITCVRLLPLVVGVLLVSLALVLVTIAGVAVVR